MQSEIIITHTYYDETSVYMNIKVYYEQMKIYKKIILITN